MKSIVKDTSKESVISYPCLMLSTEGRIVLFNKSGCGVVVSAKGTAFPLGHYSDDWYMPHFKPFNGSVTLEN